MVCIWSKIPSAGVGGEGGDGEKTPTRGTVHHLSIYRYLSISNCVLVSVCLHAVSACMYFNDDILCLCIFPLCLCLFTFIFVWVYLANIYTQIEVNKYKYCLCIWESHHTNQVVNRIDINNENLYIWICISMYFNDLLMYLYSSLTELTPRMPICVYVFKFVCLYWCICVCVFISVCLYLGIITRCSTELTSRMPSILRRRSSLSWVWPQSSRIRLTTFWWWQG